MKANKRALILGLISVSSLLFACGGRGSESSSLSSSDTSSSSSKTRSSSSSSSSKDNPMKKYGLSLEWKEGFRILWLTDIHLGNPTNTATYDETKEYAHLRTMIEEANKPDLIVFTGDTFEKETTEQVDTFVTFIDSFNLKWAFTYGNHDPSSLIDDPYYTNKKIAEAKNSVFVDYEDDGVDGLTNYYINLKNGDKNIYRLYIIDSNSYKPTGAGGDSVYDVIHLNQLEHLENIYEGEGDKAPGLAFFHIPLREYVNAYAGYTDDPQLYEGQGVKGDPFGYGYMNNGAYTVMKNCGVIGAFSGHDHMNDFDIDYFDEDNHMVLGYGLKGSDLNYYKEGQVGYKIITLPSDPSSFNHKNIVETKVPYATEA